MLFVMKKYELLYPMDVRFFGAGTVMPQTQRGTELVREFRFGGGNVSRHLQFPLDIRSGNVVYGEIAGNV